MKPSDFVLPIMILTCGVVAYFIAKWFHGWAIALSIPLGGLVGFIAYHIEAKLNKKEASQ